MTVPRGQLTVDLAAIARNWRVLRKKLEDGVECGAVVKANAYGLGVSRIATRLYVEGCRSFLVSNMPEADELYDALFSEGIELADVKIYVLAGCGYGEERSFLARKYVPVIVSMEMLDRWVDACESANASCVESVLKVNSGMGRLGLEESELYDLLSGQVNKLKAAGFSMLMSHFACADEPDHPLNAVQVKRFEQMLKDVKKSFPNIRASLSNSAGVFLSRAAHFDFVRPGIALYGGNSQFRGADDLEQVVELRLPIIQIRNLPAGEYIGYGATRSFKENRKLAVTAGGYADGVLRSLSNRGWGYIYNCKVPMVGRISMDTTIFDITDVAGAEKIKPGDTVELIGKNVSVEQVAEAAGTLSYELLISLGDRFKRYYLG